MLSWRTRLLRAGHHYDRLVADTGRLGVEAAQARAEAAAARRSLDEANRLHEQLAGHKSRLEAEVELLKAEAAKVVETQQALVEADQQRGQLADDKGRLQAEVDRLRGQVTTAEGARQDEARRREAAEKAAEDKDAELKAALAKAADLEKALEERDRAIERERRGTLLEAQHLEESFSSKCFFLVVCRVGIRPFFLVVLLLTRFFLCGRGLPRDAAAGGGSRPLSARPDRRRWVRDGSAGGLDLPGDHRRR